ncbi:MAG: NAD(+)/NADH kinase [Candidatus Omnitrophota bacterium]
MKKPTILLVYKQSALSIAGKLSHYLRENESFQSNHKAHALSLRHIEQVLKGHQVKYHKHTRSKNLNYKSFDLIITVGGDGTLLEVARGLNNRQLLLGVNSDPKWSIGKFCCSNKDTFENVLLKVIHQKQEILRLTKLHLKLCHGKGNYAVECLNDILICHANPAAMTRYQIMVGEQNEYHRNSGIWFSTAAGSTGAMLSAGGEEMPASSTDIQYKPRELYHAKGIKYHLSGGFIPKTKKALIISSMPRGCIFVDGSHVRIPFIYGHRAEISSSKNYIQLVHEPAFQ